MRRLLRVILNGLTLLAAVLCVAACVLWVRSQRVWDKADWSDDRRMYEVHSARGMVWFNSVVNRTGRRWRRHRALPIDRRVEVIIGGTLKSRPRVRDLGFHYFFRNAPGYGGRRLRWIGLIVNYWLLAG